MLDGFPKTIEQAQLLFAVDRDADGLGETDDMAEPEADPAWLPSHVVLLEVRHLRYCCCCGFRVLCLGGYVMCYVKICCLMSLSGSTMPGEG